MKISWQERGHQGFYIFLTLIFTLSLVSCAASKTHWLHLRADPTMQKRSSTKLTVGVLPFEDNRPPSQRLGQRVLSGGKEEPIRLKTSSLTQDVTSILLQFLKARDIKTVELTNWVPSPKNLEDLPEGVDIAIAGYVEKLEVEAKSSTFKTEIRYLVKLSAKFGYKSQKKVVTKKVEVRPEESVVSFKRQKVEEALNEALSSALNLLIEAALASAG